MISLDQYQVDAFAERAFAGNPAAVCPLSSWLDDRVLQAIAEENNLSETAFFVPSAKGFHLRWFTPGSEVDLCGHATLATAHILFERLGYAGESITFETRSGDLHVRRRGARLEMDFPAIPVTPCPTPDTLVQALGAKPSEVLRADVYLAVFDDEDIVRTMTPDHSLIKQLDLRGLIVTAPGKTVDFVSRFFAPKMGVPEDPVTGSAHCKLVPYWAARLGKTSFAAKQVSKRGGDLLCELLGDRVLISGSAVTVMTSKVTFDHG